ncbi:MAG TPA: AraC family transcriptional regulator [Microvirga sp.]|jgi:AraC-like DNA-binding protein|nr:AraC family transcriptional regulator [Microvirga sp.]
MLDAHHDGSYALESPVAPGMPWPLAEDVAGSAPSKTARRLPEYVGSSHVHVDSQDWPGALVSVVNVHAQGTVSVNFDTTSDLILASLEEVGSPLWIRDKTTKSPAPGKQRRSISVIPAGSDVEGEALRPQYLRHLIICFDRAQLEDEFGDEVAIDRALSRRLMHADERLMRIMRLIAEECAAGGQVDRLFAEGLMLALLSSLATSEIPGPVAEPSYGRLAPWQLRRATAYLLDNLAADIDLERLAATVELSKSHFARGFRESTGSPPHRWLLTARIDRAKSLLLASRLSLAEVALEVGFADQSHFTRTFTKFVGVSPRAWLRQRL